MIISRTPFRISFFGGGTDFPEWVSNNGGAVLSTTFDKYTYINCRKLPPFFDHKYRITYSKVENKNFINDIEHLAIRAVLNESLIDSGLEIHCDADLPARSGLGSSSSFIVGLLHSLTALKGTRVSDEWLSNEAIRIEQKVLKENVGFQDQVAAAYGGLNVIHFRKDGAIDVEPLVISPKRKFELNSHLMLFFTGFSRTSSVISKDHVENIKSKKEELTRMRTMVDDALKILTQEKDICAFGELLHDAWLIKRTFSNKVSNDSIDQIYSIARSAGAIGGKLLGAGGGGFMLLFVEPFKHNSVKQALSHLIHVPFSFENNGSQIIYYQP